MCRRLAVSPIGGLVPGFTLLCPWIFGQIAVEDPYILLHMHQRTPRSHQPWLTWRKALSCNWLWCMSKRIKESCFKEAPYQKNLLHNMLHTSKIKKRTTIWNTEPKPNSPSVVPTSSRSTILPSVTWSIRLAVAHHIENPVKPLVLNQSRHPRTYSRSKPHRLQRVW